MCKYTFYYSLCLILFTTACSSRRNLVYFSDLGKKTVDTGMAVNNIEPKIQPNDVLSISINTLSSESNNLFTLNSGYTNKMGFAEREGYRVSKEGFVRLPVVGEIDVKGQTIDQAQQTIARRLNSYVKDPLVNIQFLNFRVTVIGEVNHPSTFTVNNEKINLLEALGMAGDMTVYGKRENVLLIRETDGKRLMTRVNLNEKDVLNSPYFYLKQNDIVYVEPDKEKASEYSPNNRLMPLIVATISAIAVLGTALLGR
ncbi:polysaccharide export protein [Pseudopedobacter saltans DSM 12145]|uniref:Polysaccharide export protein n=1 Tax=Pseudopedobacter saltans (strain ATCC 51119 / DSM 12145 / JCM 21818 / CCUG 39354 / LMG 10337 / NBRC 100064 / NCIMB 13643) TaxID=762903 RepID=F0S9M7_PSESL|nr:polysaccharide biosynthesis/export family protein [Pseudopedobacter saltans]ADY51383.1 polysaccharide export protein [Pseudopedobacter saltans DSM 12145]